MTGRAFPLFSWTTAISGIKPLASLSSFLEYSVSQLLSNQTCSTRGVIARNWTWDILPSCYAALLGLGLPPTSTLLFKSSPPVQIQHWSPVCQWLSPYIGVVYCDRTLLSHTQTFSSIIGTLLANDWEQLESMSAMRGFLSIWTTITSNAKFLFVPGKRTTLSSFPVSFLRKVTYCVALKTMHLVMWSPHTCSVAFLFDGQVVRPLQE